VTNVDGLGKTTVRDSSIAESGSWMDPSTTRRLSAHGNTDPEAEVVLERLTALGRHASALRRDLVDLVGGERRQVLGEMADEAHRLAAALDRALAAERSTAVHPSQATTPPENGELANVFDLASGQRTTYVEGAPVEAPDLCRAVTGIVSEGGGLTEVLGLLIHYVRPERAPIDAAVQGLQQIPGPLADRGVDLLEAALRTGLFR